MAACLIADIEAVALAAVGGWGVGGVGGGLVTKRKHDDKGKAVDAAFASTLVNKRALFICIHAYI